MAGNKVKVDRLLSRRSYVLFGGGEHAAPLRGDPDGDRVPITGNVVRVCLLMRAPHRAVSWLCNSAANPDLIYAWRHQTKKDALSPAAESRRVAPGNV